VCYEKHIVLSAHRKAVVLFTDGAGLKDVQFAIHMGSELPPILRLGVPIMDISNGTGGSSWDLQRQFLGIATTQCIGLMLLCHPLSRAFIDGGSSTAEGSTGLL